MHTNQITCVSLLVFLLFFPLFIIVNNTKCKIRNIPVKLNATPNYHFSKIQQYALLHKLKNVLLICYLRSQVSKITYTSTLTFCLLVLLCNVEDFFWVVYATKTRKQHIRKRKIQVNKLVCFVHSLIQSIDLFSIRHLSDLNWLDLILLFICQPKLTQANFLHFASPHPTATCYCYAVQLVVSQVKWMVVNL